MHSSVHSPYSQASLRQKYAGLVFLERGHRYKWGGEFLTSVTRLVKAFAQPFDGAYWTAYKAMQLNGNKVWPDKARRLVCTPSGEFTPEEIHSWDDLDPHPEDLAREWKRLAKTAADHGTMVHKFAEHYFMGKITSPVHQGLHKWFKGRPSLLPVSLELVVGSKKWGVAGQLDVLAWDAETEEHLILDYKTNKELKKANKYDTMLPPVDHLDDCNWNHYTLQLNTYRVMLKEAGFEVNRLEILHVPSDKPTTHPPTVHRIPIMEEETIACLEAHSRSLRGVRPSGTPVGQ